jgi:hypothetical protein
MHAYQRLPRPSNWDFWYENMSTIWQPCSEPSVVIDPVLMMPLTDFSVDTKVNKSDLKPFLEPIKTPAAFIRQEPLHPR